MKYNNIKLLILFIIFFIILPQIYALKLIISDVQALYYAYGGDEQTIITCRADEGGDLDGKYWTFSSENYELYVWYEVDGSNNDPAPDGRDGIKVQITTGDTVESVNETTVFTIRDSMTALGEVLQVSHYAGANHLWMFSVIHENVTDPVDVDTGFTIKKMRDGHEDTPSEITHVFDYNHKVEPTAAVDYSLVKYTPYITTFKRTDVQPWVYGIVFNKTDYRIDIYSEQDDVSATFDEFKILLATGHTIQCRNVLIDELSGVLTESDIWAVNLPIVIEFLPLMNVGNFDIVSRSQDGLADTHNDQFGSEFTDAGKGICWAHGDNAHTRTVHTTGLNHLCVVGCGTGTPDSSNDGSYGPGLEFYVDFESTQSYATPRVAGMIAKLMINHPTWSFHDARQALRQTASFYEEGWREDGGYGAVDYEYANTVTELDLSSPIEKSFVNGNSEVDFSWVNNPQSGFRRTVIAMFDTEPTRTTEPTEEQIIYTGTLEEFNYLHEINGKKWFVFYTRNLEKYSLVEDNVEPDYWFDKVEIELSHILPYNGTLVGDPTRGVF